MRHTVFRELDWTGVKGRLVKQGLEKRGLVTRGLVMHRELFFFFVFSS